MTMSADRDSPTAYLDARPILTRGRARLLGFLAPVLIAAVATWIAGGDWIERPEGITIDWRFRHRGPRQPPENIVIVEISEASRRNLKQAGRRFNLREHLASAIENLADAGALVIGLDIWLADLTDPDVDARLAETVATTDVVLAVAYADGRIKRAPSLFLASGPSEGNVLVSPDAGILRRLPAKLYVNVLGDTGSPDDLVYVPHLPLALALYTAWEEDETAQIIFEDERAAIGPYSAQGGELIDFAAVNLSGPGDEDEPRWRTVDFEAAVLGTFDASTVAGSIILIGEAGILRDSFVMPLSDSYVPGVYYHANAVAHIIEDRHFAAGWSSGGRCQVLTGVLALAAGLFAWNQRQWWRHRRAALLLLAYVWVGVVLFLGGWMWLACMLFERNILLPVVAPLVGMGLALGSGLAAQWTLMNENVRRLALRARQIEALFGQSVSHNVLEALKRHPEQIGRTETREVAVLFCDLRGFTARSAEMSPADVAAMLNEYFNYITAAVFEHDGFVDKFVGDEIMAVFSVPFEQADHPVRAVRTAIAIKQRLAELNRIRQDRGQTPLDCGLGIHCGPAAAGHIGSRQRSNYTVVGTTVNLAARIEQQTAGGEILISEAVRQKLPPNIPVKPWKQVELRGAGGMYELYEVETIDVSQRGGMG